MKHYSVLLFLLLHVSLLATIPKLNNHLSPQPYQSIVLDAKANGYRVAIDGNTAVVAMQGDGDSYLGAVDVYTYNEQNALFVHSATLTPANGDFTVGFFGSSVAIDGDTVVVGAPSKYSTSLVYVFQKPSGGWNGTLHEDAQLSSYDATNVFGNSVAIDGSYIAVGDTMASSQTGAVFIYKTSDGTWHNSMSAFETLYGSDAIAGDYFGQNIALENDRLVVSAPQHNSNSGAIYLFEYKYENGWYHFAQSAKMEKSGGSPMLGSSLALEGDTIAATASFRFGGEVYLFEKEGSDWIQSAMITGSDIRDPQDGINTTPRFGGSLDLENDTLYVGASNHAAYTYHKPYSGWVDMNESRQIRFETTLLQSYLGTTLAHDATTFLFLDSINDTLHIYKEGVQVSLQEGEKTLIDFSSSNEASNRYTLLSTPDAAHFSLNAQSGLLTFRSAPDYESPADANGDNRYELLLQISNSDGVIHYPVRIDITDRRYEEGSIDIASFVETTTFQTPAAITSIATEGDLIVVGTTAYRNESYEQIGAAFLFERNLDGNYTQIAHLGTYNFVANQYLGSAVAISGDTIVVAAANTQSGEAGSVYLYEKPETGWSDMNASHSFSRYTQYANEAFGQTIAIDGDIVVIGAPRELITDPDRLYLYAKKEGAWPSRESAQLYISKDFDRFGFGNGSLGHSLAIQNDIIVTSAPFWWSIGAFFMYKKPAGGWGGMHESSLQTAGYPPPDNFFGMALAMKNNRIVVGAPSNTDDAALYLEERPNVGWGVPANYGTKITRDASQQHDAFGERVAFGENVIAATTNTELILFDTRTARQVRTIAEPQGKDFGAIAIEGNRLFVTYDTTIAIYEAQHAKSNVASPALIMYLLQ